MRDSSLNSSVPLINALFDAEPAFIDVVEVVDNLIVELRLVGFNRKAPKNLPFS